MTNDNNNTMYKEIELKNMFQRQQDKLLSLIYPKKKVPIIEIISLKRSLKKIKSQRFRKIKKNEKEGQYASKKRVFEAKQRKRINETLLALTKVPQYYLYKTDKKKKTNKLVKYARYWTNRKEYKIPYHEIAQLRRHKRKKILVKDSLYLTKIKNWTKLSEKRAKTFMLELNKETDIKKRHLFVTYRMQFHGGPKLKKYQKPLKPLVLNEDQQRKYKKLKELKIQLLSKKPLEFLKPATKYRKAYSVLTPQGLWLKSKLLWLNWKRHQKPGYGVDFLKTILGQRFLFLHTESQRKLQWRWRYIFNKMIYSGYRAVSPTHSSREVARKYHNAQKRAWYYTNTVIPKKLPYYFQEIALKTTYPYNKFAPPFGKNIANIWAKYLVGKRLVYNGFLSRNRRELKWLQKFSWIPFLRHKVAYRSKKNKVFYFRKKILFDYDGTHVVRIRYKARIKQLLSTTTLPFYGNLRLKQFAKIKQKAHKKKSTLLASDEIQLSSLELRLDVVVLRLNLAPTILWARRLIKDGSIYVSSNSNNEFEKMYAGYKQNTYPLKLRDPKNLYKKTQLLIDPETNNYPLATKLKFLLEPLRKIDYITKPGDVILCAPGSVMHKYKSNKVLWQKAIPKHLLFFSNITESKDSFKSRSNALRPFSRNEQPTTNVGVVLFNPKFSDISTDLRIRRSFLRWMSL